MTDATPSATKSPPLDSPQILSRDGGVSIAYHRISGASPGVVFLGGFRSDMTGTKAMALEAACRAAGRAFLRFDYRGHGQSSGDFADGTIGSWLSDALAVLDRLTDGPLVLVGSSMGGWIALLAALVRPDRVRGLVGIAAAPDFTEELIWNAVPEAVHKIIRRDGVYLEPSSYGEPLPITLRLIEEGRAHLLLGKTIPIAVPVRLLHGMRDLDVPWETSPRLAAALASEDVQVRLIKDGDHRLSRPHDLALIEAAVMELCALPPGSR